MTQFTVRIFEKWWPVEPFDTEKENNSAKIGDPGGRN